MTAARTSAPLASSSWAVARAVLIGAVLVFVLTAPTLTRVTTTGRIDTNDGRYSIWNVAWIAHALQTNPAGLLDANIFWPHRGTLAYSELNLVAGVFGWPWYAVTGSPVAALNGAAATGLLLSFVCMWALVRRLTGSDSAGLIAAVAFTFCPFVSARTPHIQLLMVFGFPLVLFAYHRLADAPTVRRGVELGVALAVAALACGYYGLYGGSALAFVALSLATRTRRYWTALLTALVTTVVLIAPLYWVFNAARAQSGETFADRSAEAAGWSANASAYLSSPAAAHAWWLPALAAWMPWSEVLFPGIGVLVLATVGLTSVRRQAPHARLIWTYAALAAMACWASFGPQAGLYRLLDTAVPGMSLLRAPARLGIVVTFSLAVIAGYGAARLLRPGRAAVTAQDPVAEAAPGRDRAVHQTDRRWLAPVLVIAIGCELGVNTPQWGWPSWPLRTVPELSSAYERLAALPRAPMVEYPFPYVSSDFHNHGLAMFWSTYHWHPLVNGYSDVIPPEFRRIALPINGFPDEASFGIMEGRGVRYVLWHMDRYDAQSRAVLEERLARYTEYLQPLVRENGGDWLYEIVRYP